MDPARAQTIQFKVRSYELDSLGHVNNAVYSNYMEYGRIEYFRFIGFDLKNHFSRGLWFVLAESRIRYRRPAFFDDCLEMTTGLILKKIRLVFWQEIRKGEEIIAEGENVIVTLNEHQRPILPPSEIQKWCGQS